MNRTATLATVVALALGLAACDRATTPTTDRTTQSGTTGTAPGSTANAGRSTGEKVDDAAITARVKSALLAESNVPGTAINVDTAGGTVTLRGRVENQTQVERAVQTARTVDGVGNVVNQLTVGAG